MKNLPSITSILGDALFEFGKAFINAWYTLPNQIDYPVDNQYYFGDIFIPIGESRKGKHYIKIGGEQSHTYIVGQSGSGKSNLVKVILTTLTKNYPGVQLYLLDYKRVELSLFKNTKNCMRFEWDPNNISQALEDLYNLVLKRYDDLAVSDETEVGPNVPPIVCVIEEISLMPKADAKILRKIMAISRAVHIYIIFTTQRPSYEVLDNVIKSLVGNRICLKTDDVKNSIISLDSEGCELLKGHGHAYYKANGIVTEIQCYHIKDDTVKAIIKDHKKVSTSSTSTKAPVIVDNNTEDWVNEL